jgi:hypothetical protein
MRNVNLPTRIAGNVILWVIYIGSKLCDEKTVNVRCCIGDSGDLTMENWIDQMDLYIQ